MYKKIFILVLFLLPGLYNNCFSQVIEEWFRTYNGQYSENLANDFTIDSSGNSYIVGYVSLNNVDSRTAFATVKFNPSGVLQWADLYQGSNNRLDNAKGVAVDKSGNVYVTGSSDDIDSSENYCTIKYNSSGEKIWIRKFQASPNSRDLSTDICLDTEGNVYVTGNTYFNFSPYYINTIKYDSSGNLLWVSRFDENLNAGKGAVSLTVDNYKNVYVAGYIYNSSSYDFCTIKYNSTGQQQWVSYYDNSSFRDLPCDIRLDKQNNLYVLGKSLINDHYEFYTVVVKYDANGNQIWDFKTDSIGFVQSYYGGKMSFKIDEDGNSYIGTTYKKNSSLLKIDSSGTLLWNEKFTGQPTYMFAIGRAIDIDNEGFIYLNGTATKPFGSHDFCTLKYNSSGVLLWVRTFHSAIPSDDESAFINVDSKGNVFVAGIAYTSNDVISKFGVVKYSQSVGIANISSEIPDNYNLYQNFPNPFNPMTVIRYSLIENRFTTLKVYDALGKIVSTLVNEKQNTGTYEVEFDGNDFPSGVYYYKLSAGNFSQTKRMLLLK